MKYFYLLIFLILVNVSCLPSEANKPSQAQNKAATYSPANNELILDVRTQGEWNAGHVKSATHIPVNEVEKKIQHIKKLVNNNMNQPIKIYCAVGGRAGQAKEILEQHGFKNVTNAGGLKDMKKLNYPVE